MRQTHKLLLTRKIQSLVFFTVLFLSACQAESPPTLVAVKEPSPTVRVMPEPTATESVSASASERPEVIDTATPQKPANPLVYQIVGDKSEVRFYISELLFGEPKTVIGRSRDVSGEILLDMAVPTLAQIGLIRVNALDLTTDNSFRNRALRSQILESNKDEYQYILFDPVSIDGLPDEVIYDEPVEIRVTGNLTIRESTNPITFEMLVTPVSEMELSGTGAAVVMREAFSLEIPSVTGVAQVSEEVRLEIDFVAQAQQVEAR